MRAKRRARIWAVVISRVHAVAGSTFTAAHLPLPPHRQDPDDAAFTVLSPTMDLDGVADSNVPHPATESPPKELVDGDGLKASATEPAKDEQLGSEDDAELREDEIAMAMPAQSQQASEGKTGVTGKVQSKGKSCAVTRSATAKVKAESSSSRLALS